MVSRDESNVGETASGPRAPGLGPSTSTYVSWRCGYGCGLAYEFLVNALGDCVADGTEGGEFFVVGSFSCGGVWKTPMKMLEGARKDWTMLFGVVAYGDDVLDGRTEILGGVFRCLTGDVDADLMHYFDGERIHSLGGNACTQHLQAIVRTMAKISLCHLAAGGIAGAKKQDFWFHRPGTSHNITRACDRGV